MDKRVNEAIKRLAYEPPRDRALKVLVHDYAGHPFQVSLSRELARRGHRVIHAYFGGDKGPKGDFQPSANEHGELRFEALQGEYEYDKASLVRRRFADIKYGKIVARLIENEKPDIVLSGNTPTEAQSYVVKACRTTSSTFIYWLQDFYSIAASKLLRKRLGFLGGCIGLYYQFLERRQLRSADAIVTITTDFEDLSRRWGGKGKVTTIENWGLSHDIIPGGKQNSWSERNGLSTSFNFVYSGTLGLKHNPMLLRDLARATRGRANVVIVSQGVGVTAIEKVKASEQLDNLLIFPLVTFSELQDVLATADVAVAMIEPDAGLYSVPSKVQSYMCAGKPVLLAAPGANLASKVIRKQQAGLVAEPDDHGAFIALAEQMLTNTSLRAEFGANGRAYADRNFDISVVTDRFLDVFDRAFEHRARNSAGARV